jgi:hypothetical protein
MLGATARNEDVLRSDADSCCRFVICRCPFNVWAYTITRTNAHSVWVAGENYFLLESSPYHLLNFAGGQQRGIRLLLRIVTFYLFPIRVAYCLEQS